MSDDLKKWVMNYTASYFETIYCLLVCDYYKFLVYPLFIKIDKKLKYFSILHHKAY